MRAVVDEHVGRVVVIRAASSARISRRLMDRDRTMRLRQADGGSKPCQPRSDDMDSTGLDERMPQRNPYQMGLVDVHRLARRRPATRYHVLQHLAIDHAHDFRGADDCGASTWP